LVEPVIIEASVSSLIWVGVDQKLVAINTLGGNIVVALQLDSNLIDILSIEANTAVLTETDLFLFNSDGSIQQVEALPEIGSGLSVTDNVLCVDMLDGEILSIVLEA
jgi:hypothetical protein